MEMHPVEFYRTMRKKNPAEKCVLPVGIEPRAS